MITSTVANVPPYAIPEPPFQALADPPHATTEVEKHPRLFKATLCCRLCTRAVGDVVAYRSRPLAQARFIPIPGGLVPRVENGGLRCGRCGGQLHLDDIEPLGRSVQLSEVGGIPFHAVARIVRDHDRRAA